MIALEEWRSPAPSGVCDRLPALSLAQLQEEASFLIRVDRKYVVPNDTLQSLLAGVEPGTRALEIDGRRTFGYSTRYFDDDENTAYFRALRKRPDRFKVRTRRYDERGECLLEVKLLDGRGHTVKSRFHHDADRFETLSALDRAWLQSFPAVRRVALRLDPNVATHYQRSTLVFPAGSGRMTIDQDLTFIGPEGTWQRLDGFSVVEIKGWGRALPFDRLLWSKGYRPVPVSKFALGVSLLHPELPDNRWHRLRRQLAPALVPTCASFESVVGLQGRAAALSLR
jgi:hypothetical protein